MITAEITRRRVADIGVDLVHAECTAHRFRPHLHPDLAFGVNTSGRHMLRCDSGTHVVGPGDVVVVNAREVHTGESLDRLPWSYSMFYVPEPLVRQLAAPSAALPETAWTFPTAVIHDAPLAQRLALLHREVRSHRPDAAQHGLAAVLREFIGRFAVPKREPSEPARPKPHESARTYIEQHYAEPLHLAELSRVSGVSVFHLVHAFKQAVGIPPGAYLRQIRIAGALALLRAGRPVAEVARATAFSDQSHFTKRFKETLGYPPGAYLRAVLSSAASWAYRDPTR